ncbi:MAG: isoaspartyl peptidase/L-asparaginase, partial [Planctomycetota bacterium]|nr:isoaspartyl peptidase/L-asparaginase [Planctomycetota bacterium]
MLTTHSSIRFALLGIGLILSTRQLASADDRYHQQQSGNQSIQQELEPRKVKYAIVLHGGAGSSPRQFNAARNLARRQSLEKAIKKGQWILSQGGSSLDAVEAVIRIMEDDPVFNAGKGAVFNVKGEFELDASIMDGSNRACGAVAGVTIAKNPISLARLVMTQTRHVLLSSTGADEFAKQQKVKLVPNNYFQTPATKARWERQQEAKRSKKTEKALPVIQAEIPSYFGTVGCVALDHAGNLAAGTSTGGLSNKKFGRVGDSPIVGAGTYADNETC